MFSLLKYWLCVHARQRARNRIISASSYPRTPPFPFNWERFLGSEQTCSYLQYGRLHDMRPCLWHKSGGHQRQHQQASGPASERRDRSGPLILRLGDRGGGSVNIINMCEYYLYYTRKHAHPPAHTHTHIGTHMRRSGTYRPVVNPAAAGPPRHPPAAGGKNVALIFFLAISS